MGLRRRVPGHAYCKDKLALTHQVDTAAANINLFLGVRCRYIGKRSFSGRRVMNNDRSNFKPASARCSEGRRVWFGPGYIGAASTVYGILLVLCINVMPPQNVTRRPSSAAQ
jgi:hypothetical protein